MGSSMIPPPPPGFTLDQSSGSVPPPPPGFTLDSDNPSTLAEKATSIVNTLTPSMNSITPSLTTPVAPFLSQEKQVLQTGQAADKRYPAENLLPAIGAGIGATIGGGAATIGSGGPGLPFGATLGAGVGGGVGDVARQYVSALRGNQGVPQTPQESLISAGGQAVKMAGSELAGAALVKTLMGTLGLVSGAARKGLGKFTDYFLNETKPVDKSVTDALRAKYANAPVGDVSETASTAKNILEKKGFNVSNPSELPSSMSPQQIQNFQDAGMSVSDIQGLAKAGVSGTESGVKQIASQMKPKLVSDLKSLDPTDFKQINNIYQDLSNPETVSQLTYGDLQNIKNEVGQYANFNVSNPEMKRTPIDTMYGKVYDKIRDLMTDTAEKNGFLKDHELIQGEGYKYFQNKFLQNLKDISMNYGENPLVGPQQDWGAMAQKMKSMTPVQVKMIFGDNADKFNTLRELVSSYSNVFLKAGEPTGMINSMSGMPYVRQRLPNPYKVLSRPDYVESIVSRNLGPEAVSQVGPTAYPGLLEVQGAKMVGKPIYPSVGNAKLEEIKRRGLINR